MSWVSGRSRTSSRTSNFSLLDGIAETEETLSSLGIATRLKGYTMRKLVSTDLHPQLCGTVR